MPEEHPIAFTPDKFMRVAEQHPVYVSMLKTRFTVPHLIAVYRQFGGDMALVIVLGEIALRNFQKLLETNIERKYLILDPDASAALNDSGLPSSSMSPATIATVARTTGIPRETVRRKVDTLLARGWIERSVDGTLRLGASLSDLREFDRAQNLAFARAAGGLLDLLSEPDVVSAPLENSDIENVPRVKRQARD